VPPASRTIVTTVIRRARNHWRSDRAPPACRAATRAASSGGPRRYVRRLDQLPILYRDDTLVAIHKPSGLLVHRSIIDAHEERFAVQMLRDQIGQQVHPVHRLDKGTSGVLLFALDRETAALVGRTFERRT